MKKRFLLILMMAIALLIVTASAYALTFNYAGDSVVFDGFDWAPGNAIGVNSVPLSSDPANQTSFDLFYQASLSSFTLDGKGVGSNLGDDYEVTMVAGAREKGYRSPIGQTGENAIFKWDDDPDAVNFFEIWVDSSMNSNSLAGTGFNDGDKIIEGVITGGGGNFAVELYLFDEDANDYVFIPPVALDQYKDNDYPDVYTIGGSGKTDALMEADVTKIDSSIILGQILSMSLNFRTDNATPFEFVDPSALFYDGSTYFSPKYGQLQIGSDDDGNPVYQTVNGLTSADGNPVDFHFEADARTTVTSQVIPEPGTMFLLGFGLLGICGIARRKRLN